MELEFGVIANPRAGKRYIQLEDLHRLSKSRLFHDNTSFNITNNVDEVKPTLMKLINEYGVKIIFVYGGDGTAQKVVNILIYEFSRGRIKYIPKIVLLGGGTQKAIFQWLGWTKEDPEEIFLRVVQTPIEQLPIRKLRPLQITFTQASKQRQETHYGFIFIIGAVNRVINLYDSQGKSFLNGLKHVGLGLMAGLTKFPRSHAKLMHQFKAEVEANGQRVPQSMPLNAICSVTESLLFGIEPFAGKAETNQFYTACYAIPAWMISVMLPGIVRAHYVPPTDPFFNKPVTEFGITPESEKSFFLDGEFYHIEPGTKITVTRAKEEIEMIPHF